jgi:hypothetical protein
MTRPNCDVRFPLKADIRIDLHVPLCFAPGTTDTTCWQAVACLAAARNGDMPKFPLAYRQYWCHRLAHF